MKRIPEPDVPAILDQMGSHTSHDIGQLWVCASSNIPGQWETWYCRTCQIYFDKYVSQS